MPTTLAERMKSYEQTYETSLPRRTYTLFRLDGRAFSKYTRGMDKPFDMRFVAAMDETAKALCREITGTCFAYTQSDEISLLVTDFATHATQPWMGGRTAKMLSLSAARATAAFNTSIDVATYGAATFDSRVWTMSDPNEVANYFIWRQRDAIKNSISMLASHYFTHSELQGKMTKDRVQMLKDINVDWFEKPTGVRHGRVAHRHAEMRSSGVRSSWRVFDAPPFKIIPGDWLPSMIPPLPSLPRDVQDAS